MKKQWFIDFLCEIMRYSPLGKQHFGYNNRNRNDIINDLLGFFDEKYAGEYYQGERKFLLDHCQSRSIFIDEIFN